MQGRARERVSPLGAGDVLRKTGAVIAQLAIEKKAICRIQGWTK